MTRKDIVILSMALIIALGSFAVYAQDDGEEELRSAGVPPGMVMKKIGGRNVVIPRDSWVRKRGDILIYEDINAYIGRKMIEVEEHIAKIEADLEAIQKEIDGSKI